MQVPVYEPVYMGVMHVHMDMAMVMVMDMDMDMDMVMVMDMCDVSVLYGSLLSDCPMAYPSRDDVRVELHTGCSSEGIIAGSGDDTGGPSMGSMRPGPRIERTLNPTPHKQRSRIWQSPEMHGDPHWAPRLVSR